MQPELVAVEATEERYRALRHQPGGEPIDPVTGRGVWPADQFTWSLRDEGSIRIVDAASTPAASEDAHDEANRVMAKSRRG